MTDTIDHGARHRAPKNQRVTKGVLGTLPFVLVGSMAVGLGLTGPIEPIQARPKTDKPKSHSLNGSDSTSDAVKDASGAAAAFAVDPVEVAAPEGMLSTAAAPSTYAVKAGDTISSIAGRYGLATASVLALNGLGWKSVIFPGQVIKLTAGAAPIAVAAKPTVPGAGTYTIQKGDTIGRIAARFGVAIQALLSANGLSWSSIIYPGQSILVPARSTPAAVSATPVPTVPPAAPALAAPTPAAPAPESQTPAAQTPAAQTPAAQSRYTIQSGDTVSRIARTFGVSAQAILTANGLNWSSIIYSGRSLVIPGEAMVSTANVTATAIPGMTAEMTTNARTIVGVGRSLGVPEYGLVIALAAAMQESGLRNLDYGDRDSLGLFQQRPSTGWGTPAQVRDTTHSARLFFGGPSNPNKGKTRGLLDIPGWQSKTVAQAAQAVQRSGHPDAYAKWEAPARAWLKQL
ncbi:hypothetical protein BH09ACT3_BH09ACT3_00700 [soil metagenome]